MKRIRYKKLLPLLITSVLIATGGFACLFVPTVQMRTGLALTWIRGWIDPSGQLPTAESEKNTTASTPMTFSAIMVAPETVKLNSVSSASTPAAVPGAVALPPPAFDPKKDYQDWNNCGPATLALALRFWDWQGDQYTISKIIKPVRQDKNVNIDELAGYVDQYTANLQAITRVGGDLAVIKKFVAAGFPVVIEESFMVEKTAWPGDDLWAAHFLLITGYDDESATFITQDSYTGPNRTAAYSEVERNWQSFNHVYLVIYPVERQAQIQTLLGVDWQSRANIERTIIMLQNQIQLEPDNAYAWFNLGSNLIALNDGQSAFSVFKTARQLGLPQRMLRYQFGPFIAAYQTGEMNDLAQLLEFSLKITPDSEEALYWKGMTLLQAGDKQGAAFFFRKALEANPGFVDAKNELEIINS